MADTLTQLEELIKRHGAVRISYLKKCPEEGEDANEWFAEFSCSAGIIGGRSMMEAMSNIVILQIEEDVRADKYFNRPEHGFFKHSKEIP